MGVVAWRRMAERAAEAAEEPRARHQPARAARRFPDRRAAARRALARAVLGRAHHHSRRADLGFVAARDRTAVRRSREAARRRPKHHLHLAFPRRHSQDLERDHDLPQRPQGRDGRGHAGDRQGLDHRAHDRLGPRGARGELPRRDQARQPPGGAGRAAGEGSDARAFLSRSHVRGARRRSSRDLRLHGLRAARTGADPVRQVSSRERIARDRRQGDDAQEHDARPRRRASPMSPRAAARCCSATSPCTRTCRSRSSSACRSGC